MRRIGYTLLTEQSGPRELVWYAAAFAVDSSRVWDMPTEPVRIAVAVAGDRAVDQFAPLADDMIAVEPAAEACSAFSLKQAEPFPSRDRAPVRQERQPGRGLMYTSEEARELAMLLGVSRELHIHGDVAATVDNPSELLAIAAMLADPVITAWTGPSSARGSIQVCADRTGPPIHGRLTVVLACEQHPIFWDALSQRLDRIEPHTTRHLTVADLTEAWSAMPTP